MKAAVYREYGHPREVLKYDDIERPVNKDDEVLIRVRAAAINPLDCHLMTTSVGRLMGGGLLRPKQPVPGVDVAGVVEVVGSAVTEFKQGDEVFGCCEGAFAEYAVAPAKKLAAKPGNVHFEEVAGIGVAGTTALQALRDAGQVGPGQTVLIIGASGGVGTFAVQIAKTLGAHVSAVCSAGNADLVLELGANVCLDRGREDFACRGGRYDVIFDLVGDRPLNDYRRALKPEGIYVGAGLLGQGPPNIGVMINMLKPLLLSLFISQKLSFFMAKINSGDLAEVAKLLETGTIRSVVDKSYPLSEAAGAIQYVREKRARGKVVIVL